MIAVTRLDGTPMVVNVDQVERVEQTPDTLVTVGGERLRVRESPQEHPPGDRVQACGHRRAAGRRRGRRYDRTQWPRPTKKRLDLTSLTGVPISIGLMLLGQAIEGGNLRSLLQLAAALIVFGGTFGAVLVRYSVSEVWRRHAACPAHRGHRRS